MASKNSLIFLLFTHQKAYFKTYLSLKTLWSPPMEKHCKEGHYNYFLLQLLFNKLFIYSIFWGLLCSLTPVKSAAQVIFFSKEVNVHQISAGRSHNRKHGKGQQTCMTWTEVTYGLETSNGCAICTDDSDNLLLCMWKQLRVLSYIEIGFLRCSFQL